MSSEATATSRLQTLVDIETTVQQKWAESKPYNVDAPTCPEERKKRNKFMVTFPYPYMNGALHLGHAFTMVKAEYAVRFQRLLGKRAVFPFGFHCTGMPILACAKRLQEELATFGIQGPPAEAKKNDAPTPAPVEEAASEAPATPEVEAKVEAKGDEAGKRRAKLAAKNTGLTWQWNIMRSMNVPEAEIAEFANPRKWLDYWPPIAQKDLTRLGMAIDWRRTFITTDVNPYYDAFVKWQFNILKQKNKISYGKLTCIYSTANSSVCADHDRKEGEGVGPQDYTLVKLTLQKPYPQSLTDLCEKSENAIDLTKDNITVYLPAATLRPETMYGQTNAFLKPDGEYGVYIMNDNEVFVCSQHSANNMAYQEIFGAYNGVEFTEPKTQLSQRHVGDILGAAFFGFRVKAPLCPYESVYLFPLTTILMDKGTGVVTSVPSDAPTDYATFMEIKVHKRDYYRNTYGITDEMVAPYEVIPIINITDEASNINTNCIAKDLCEQYKVTTHKDSNLPKLKDEAYRLGFDKGVMIVGPYKGQPIKETKDLCKRDLIATNDAIAYAEPESKVVSRLNDICVCAKIDQWFLTYGEASWQKQIHDHVANDDTFNSYNTQIKTKLLATIAWLQRWGCSRAFGLGSKMPFDENFLIESLSDSTIYMAYYTIVQILQGSHYNGAMPSEAELASGMSAPQVGPDQLNDALFSYIFLETPYDPTQITVPQETCDAMRREFEFWYPHDLRVSGKDLLQNHLVMSLYNHAAVWDGRTDRMPGGYYANGLLMIDGNKMSKSTGNFLTLSQAIDKYGADSVRFALAASGDSLEDANFSTKTADGAVMRLALQGEIFNEQYLPHISRGLYRSGPFEFWDLVALQRMNDCIQRIKNAYNSMQMQEVIRQFHSFLAIRDDYRIAITPEGSIVTRSDYIDSNYHESVIITFMRAVSIILSPITPHWCQDLHEKLIASGLLEKINNVTINVDLTAMPTLIVDEQWPVISVPESTDSGMSTTSLVPQASYLLGQSDAIRLANASFAKLYERKAKKGEDGKVPPINHVTIRVATGYPEWQQKIINMCREYYLANGTDSFVDAALFNALKTNVTSSFDGKQKTNAMKFLMELVNEYKASPIDDEAQKFENIFSLTMPFDEVALWNKHTSFLIRAMAPISTQTPESYNIAPFDPSNPVDEDGKPLLSCPRPGKPLFIFSRKD